jgi:hypothetical protein
MCVGEKRKLKIPADMGYGDRGSGSGKIPGQWRRGGGGPWLRAWHGWPAHARGMAWLACACACAHGMAGLAHARASVEHQGQQLQYMLLLPSSPCPLPPPQPLLACRRAAAMQAAPP